MKKYIWRNLIAIDQLVNALFNGDPDETISSRLGKYRDRHGKLCWYLAPIGWMLEKLDPGHLTNTQEPDEGIR
jgi:hypothetical protein